MMYLTATVLGRVLRDEHVTDRMLAVIQPLFPGMAGDSLRDVALDLRTDAPFVLLAVPVLFWVSSTVFASLELAVNIAFERIPRRTWVRARLKSFALVSTGMAILLASLVSATFIPTLERLLWDAGVLDEGTRLAGTLSRMLLVITPLALFATFYKVLPRGRVRWRAAGWGALLALGLWETARRVFGLVLVRSPALGLFSGALSGIVTVLLWVYAAVALMLLGAEFAALRNERIESVEKQEKSDE